MLLNKAEVGYQILYLRGHNSLSVGVLKYEMTDYYWLLRCWVEWDFSQLLAYDVRLWLVARRIMTMIHYSCTLLLHTHYVNDLLRMTCLRFVGVLRTGDCCDVVTGFQPRHLSGHTTGTGNQGLQHTDSLGGQNSGD